MRSLPSSLLLLIICLLTYATHDAYARRVRVKHDAAPADTMRIDPGVSQITDSTTLSGITLAGYDKTRESNRESIFVTNSLPHTLTAVTLLIDYRTIDGRQLHRRSTTVPCVIPPSQTRRLDFRTWDNQHIFYYHQSPAPKRAEATPYDVAIRITQITLAR